MLCSPCDEEVKRPNAGVGISAVKGITMVAAEIKGDVLQRAHKAGRVAKYQIDLDWQDDLTVYVLNMQEGLRRQEKALSRCSE